jgi:hypothetical protein
MATDDEKPAKDADESAASNEEATEAEEKLDAKASDDEAKAAAADDAAEDAADGEAESKAEPEGKTEAVEDEAAADPAPERMRRSRARGAKPISPPPPAASLGKSVVLFVAVFVLLAAGFAFLSSNDPFSERNAPKWRKGQKVQLNITLDPRDDMKLACASKTVIEGKRCEFEAKNQKYAGALEDKALLRPYTTTDGVQFLAAGLWSHPDLDKGKRPRERFTVACTFVVDGSVASPAIRWDPAGAWNEKNQSWFAGSVTECKVVQD